MEVLARASQAQIRPTLIIDKWSEEPHWSETFDDLFFQERVNTKGDGAGTSVFYWDSRGRIKFPRAEIDPRVTIGYKVFTLGIDSEASRINGAFNDVAIATAVRVAEFSYNFV